MEYLWRVWHASRERYNPSGHLVPSPFLGLACAPIVETRFFKLVMSLLNFWPWIPLGTFSILHCWAGLPSQCLFGICKPLIPKLQIKPNWFDRGKSWKWAFETNKIFALDQSLPSFQGETNMFSASLSIASFDKKSGRGYHWTMFPGRLIHCKSSESRICICNWSENNNLSGFFSHVFLFFWSMLLIYTTRRNIFRKFCMTTSR